MVRCYKCKKELDKTKPHAELKEYAQMNVDELKKTQMCYTLHFCNRICLLGYLSDALYEEIQQKSV